MGLAVSGLSSGIDWQNILEQLRQVETSKVTLLTKQKSAYESKLSAWKTFNTKLSALQSAAENLKSSSDFKIYTPSLSTSSTSVSASSLLSVTASSDAGRGSYQVAVNNLAQVEKLASGSFSSQSDALGVSGTLLVNGHAIRLDATDTLQDLRTTINGANTGDDASSVVASIIKEKENSYRLVLTSEAEGAAGISLLNGSSGDTLSALGFNDSGSALKNQVVGAARSDAFSSASTSVEALLGIASENLSGSVTLNGMNVTIDLTRTLTQIKDDLVAAGISAEVVTQTDGTATSHSLQIEGLTSWTDDSNVLQAMGIVEGARGDIVGVTSGNASTTDGSTPISDSTKIVDVYGYLNYTAGDKITISGATHDGTSVSATDFAIDGTKTIGDLLSAVETAFGNPGDVSASITSDGKIQITDNLTGGSQLAVDLSTTLTGTNPGTLDFGTFSAVGTVHRYVLQQGEDAKYTVDGMEMTSATNTVSDAIPGLTLTLLGEDANTPVTVDVDTDFEGVQTKVQSMLDAYNGVMSYINSQMTYNADSKETGGALFGDTTLKSIKSQMQSMLLTPVGTGDIKYLSSLGITMGSGNTLTMDTSKFRDVLESNFEDVIKMFGDYASFSDSGFEYMSSGSQTQPGTYAIDITQAASGGSSVEGTIDGLAASGTGSLLSMNNSSSSAYGLMIKYTGTTPKLASVTFTRGIASLLEAATNSLTDSIDGTVKVRENSIQSSIDALNKKITRTEDLIDRRMALLSQQFQSMEAALGRLSSLSSYLSTQLASLS